MPFCLLWLDTTIKYSRLISHHLFRFLPTHLRSPERQQSLYQHRKSQLPQEYIRYYLHHLIMLVIPATGLRVHRSMRKLVER